jgi:VWFA-related protein
MSVLMTKSLRFVVVLALLAGVVFTAGPSSQSSQDQAQPVATTPTPTFKAQVEYVEVDALVTDAQGRSVRSLTRDDFQVFEDGKRQNITSFTLVDIPVERPDRPLFQPNALEPDVASNERPFDGRVYVMILDDLHMAALRSQLAKNAARQFIQRNLGANDLMAIVTTGGRSDQSLEFTNNRRLLLAAVDKLMGQKLTSATINRSAEYYRTRDLGLPTSNIGDPQDLERAHNARNTLTTVKAVAEWFGGVRGRRKSILFVSEGIDYDVTDLIRNFDSTPSSASTILDDTREAIAAATRNNVSIYAIDPRGLTSLADETIGVSSLPDFDDPSIGIGNSSLNNELRLSQDSLRTLADETGGFAAVNTNQFANAFERIVNDNSAYYVLAYYPPSNKRDGKFHKIEVRVARPGLTVRSRKGYQAPRGKAPVAASVTPGKVSTEVTEALNSPIPVSGLGMRIFAAPFKGTAPNASVLLGVELVGRDLALVQDGKVEISYFAFDTAGKVKAGSTDSLTTNLRPETKTRVQQTGFRMLNRLQLPPGRYHIRVASHDSAGGRLGSVAYDLEVPDFAKQAFTMSGVIMTSMTTSGMVTPKADDSLKDVMPAPPIASRVFPQNDEIALFAEVYDNQSSTPHRVDIVTTIQTDEGKVVFKTEDERNSSELQGGKGGYGYTTRIPLIDVPPGDYVLSVQARSRLGDNVGVGRQIRIVVAPPVRTVR